MILSCPSKTFLLGEYIALGGGPTLVALTEPRFRLSVEKGRGQNPFHPESPAGRLWSREFAVTRDWSCAFDNASSLGGFGASTAQYLLLHAALQVFGTLAYEAQLEPDVSRLLEDYQRDAVVSGGLQPSGADLIAQLKGLVTLFERSRGRLESRGWAFPNLSLQIYSTGHKLATHDHLPQVKGADFSALEVSGGEGVEAWLRSDAPAFVGAVREYRRVLRSLKLEAATTTTLLGDFESLPGVLAAKGCGAMGADTVILLVEREQATAVRQKVGSRLTWLAGDGDLSPGLQVVPRTVAQKEVTP